MSDASRRPPTPSASYRFVYGAAALPPQLQTLNAWLKEDGRCRVGPLLTLCWCAGFQMRGNARRRRNCRNAVPAKGGACADSKRKRNSNTLQLALQAFTSFSLDDPSELYIACACVCHGALLFTRARPYHSTHARAPASMLTSCTSSNTSSRRVAYLEAVCCAANARRAARAPRTSHCTPAILRAAREATP